ncbi:uncharacterized membrane protein YgdD (TMEM256/DUF423 family) [Alteromonadaceae bacterium 2753L.S.0a.02]|nr:uncharacterized membrane protein YgdD (TMEM256/DUF423 family) [Alteromonadaceae bacterium 2753L.S.0a.02]
MLNSKLIFCFASCFGASAVMLGAFGAHSLKNTLSESQLAVWQTAVHYQFYHTMALLAVGLMLLHGMPPKWLQWSAGAFVLGILFFSGSLYALALGGPRLLGPITPLGGLAFIVGWLMLLLAVVKH